MHEEAGPSDLGATVDVPDIFLSHSGQDNDFVENLYNALVSDNYTAFFEKHASLEGSSLPDNIEQALLDCKVVVVVLSEKFITSKWSMMELEMLVKHRGMEPDANILPLCYKLDFESLKSPENLVKWRHVWKVEGGEDAAKWEKTVRDLAQFNGEIHKEGSETARIKKVVGHICTLVPRRAPYGTWSSMQGHQRLAQEIDRMFDQVHEMRREESVCIVGLHGVGGLGKTTLCKTMVDFYTSQYNGRSCLIEFPSDGDERAIIKSCKKALKKLTKISEQALSGVADDFDEVVHLMEEHVHQNAVFLALDNVWENSREQAERLIYCVGFTPTSKILLTSRSEEVLEDALTQHADTCYIMGPLPTPNKEEALQILQTTYKRGDLSSLLDRNQIDSILETGKFSGDYNAKALKALGEHLKKLCGSCKGQKKFKKDFDRFVQGMSNIAGKGKFEGI